MIRAFRAFADFIKIIFYQRYLIFSLAKRQVKAQFIGSLLGFLWTFINPLVMIMILWFVFSVGLKTRPSGDIPFVVWLAAGMAIWTAFNDIVTGCLSVIIENQSLIKKTLIQAHILPVSRILSALVAHLVFVVILFGLMVLYEMPLTFYVPQFLYYYFSMTVLALGIGWCASAINVFIRDTGQVVNLMLQIFFWVTPIMWDTSIMPRGLQPYLYLNPIYYLVQGYRDSFFYHVPFWKHLSWTLYFWTVAAACFIAGGLVFRKAKPHFADVL